MAWSAWRLAPPLMAAVRATEKMRIGIAILTLGCLIVFCQVAPKQTSCNQMSAVDAELFFAVLRGNTNQAASALQKGASVDSRHHGLMAAARLEGATPLYTAVFCNQPEMVTWLLAHGADADIPNGAGETPLQLAEKRKLSRIIDILKKEGSNRGLEAIGGPRPPQSEP